MLSSVILWIRFFISPLKWPILLILIIFLACVVRFLRSINVDTGIKLYYVRERKLLTLCPCRWSKLQYFCMNSTVFPYLLWHWLYWNIFVFIILYSTFYKHLYAFIIDNLHTSHMIIYVVNGFAKTHPSAHISLLTTAAMIIFPWGKADPESVSAVMSAVCEMVQYELPFRPQHYAQPSTTSDWSTGGSESMSPSEHEKGVGQGPQHGLPLTAHMETMALAACQWWWPYLVSRYIM